MAAQADGLLVHGHLVGEDSGLGEDAPLVDGGGGQHLPHFLLQPLPIGRHGLGRLPLHPAHGGLDGHQAARDVLRQAAALHGPHIVIGGQGLIQHLADVGGHGLQVLLGLGDGENVRQLGKGHGGHIPLQGEHALQLGQGLVIAPGQGLVHRHHGHVRSAGVDGDEHVHLAPGHSSPDPGLHGVLGKYVSTGHFHRAVQKAVVDRAHLHGDVPLVQGLSGPAVAGHAFDQCKLLLSIVPQQQK